MRVLTMPLKYRDPLNWQRKPGDQLKIGAAIASDAQIKNDDLKSTEALGFDLKQKISEIFGRSLSIREVDAGSCNGCEVEVYATTYPFYDLERFGIHVVPSPRHADMLLVSSRSLEIWNRHFSQPIMLLLLQNL